VEPTICLPIPRTPLIPLRREFRARHLHEDDALLPVEGLRERNGVEVLSRETQLEGPGRDVTGPFRLAIRGVGVSAMLAQRGAQAASLEPP